MRKAARILASPVAVVLWRRHTHVHDVSLARTLPLLRWVHEDPQAPLPTSHHLPHSAAPHHPSPFRPSLTAPAWAPGFSPIEQLLLQHCNTTSLQELLLFAHQPDAGAPTRCRGASPQGRPSQACVDTMYREGGKRPSLPVSPNVVTARM